MASAPKPPKPVDPLTIINAETQANRVGRTGPFGSALYGTGPNGQATINTELSPQMQQLVDRQFGLANTNAQRLSLPEGFSGLQNALMQRVGGNLGQTNRLSNFNAAQQQGALPPSVLAHYAPGNDPSGRGQMPPKPQQQQMPPPGIQQMTQG
jgi:hypothetical protein